MGVVPIPSPADWVRKDGHRAVLESGRAHILQRYIDRPLLVDGYKSEIRLYFLVASVQPLRVFWYPQGSVRLAVRPFQHSHWRDPLVHIVNTAQGKRTLGEKEYAELVKNQPRKLSFAELSKYHLTKNVTTTGDTWRHILSQILSTVKTVLRAAAPSLQHPPEDRREKWHAFALMGADFIVDSDHKVWLTEMQEGPGLSHIAERVKEDFVPAMVSEAARIGLKAASSQGVGGAGEGLTEGTGFLPLI